MEGPVRTFINWLLGVREDYVNLGNLDNHRTLLRWDADAKFRSRLA
jgi:hypothetical protein